MGRMWLTLDYKRCVVTTKEVMEYYQQTKQGVIRPELEYALSISSGGGIAIDCGCGAGSDIAHLRAAGYIVHAFDINEQSIALCAARYKNDSNVFLSVDSFGSFLYPGASLIIADASLFFCPTDEFDLFIDKIEKSLEPHGVFCGAFLGARDTMSSPGFESEKYWGDVLVLSEEKIKTSLKKFEIHQFVEHESDGFTPTGDAHHWHIFIVVAKLT